MYDTRGVIIRVIAQMLVILAIVVLSIDGTLHIFLRRPCAIYFVEAGFLYCIAALSTWFHMRPIELPVNKLRLFVNTVLYATLVVALSGVINDSFFIHSRSPVRWVHLAVFAMVAVLVIVVLRKIKQHADAPEKM